MFGLARSPALLNYWLMCSPAPQAGVHLWFTLFRVKRSVPPPKDSGRTDDVKEYFQWLPTTSLGHTPLVPQTIAADSTLQEQMKPYLLDHETVEESYQSLHIAKATNVALFKNAFHFRLPLKYFTRLPSKTDRPSLQEMSKAPLYLRDAMLR